MAYHQLPKKLLTVFAHFAVLEGCKCGPYFPTEFAHELYKNGFLILCAVQFCPEDGGNNLPILECEYGDKTEEGLSCNKEGYFISNFQHLLKYVSGPADCVVQC